MSKGRIKMKIDTSGAVAINMTDFKKCKDKTKEILNELQMDADTIQLAEEEVATTVGSNATVGVKR